MIYIFNEDYPLINLYGTEDEQKRINELLNKLSVRPDNIEAELEISAVNEEIFRREFSKTLILCGRCCEYFEKCPLKLFRENKGMIQYCCRFCADYEKCARNK